ncbi:M30 family zinc metallopeptidase [Acetobacterium wieringae]|uniref:M30 family zinc metallopeptidase n=1 Tax=Acetobacterium wieringae TaxID=52694 RepID=UPI0039825BAB
MDSEELDPEAYRINPVIPFEPVAGQEPVNFNMDGEMQVQATYQVNDTKSFIVDKESLTSPATVTGRCAYNGTHVQVWVDNDANAKVKLTNAQAKPIGEEFDNKIYPLVTNNFGVAPNVDSDGKIAILCFDIADTYSGPGTGYTAGFFYGGDLYKNSQLSLQNSNEMEIFYADTYPTMIKNPETPDYDDPDVTKVYSTLAHEFQHMVNFNQNCLVEGEKKAMDTWLNEALSLAAEQMYNGTQINRITYYNSSTAIQNGHSLLSWQNGSDVLANYSLSYLFSQYLRTQIDQAKGSGEGIKTYKSIIEDPAENYVAVQNVIQTKIDSKLTFGQFMTNFRAAMLLKADSGPYGFNNEEGFDTIITPLYTGGTIDLKGGGAVVKSITNEVKPTGKGANITYLGIYN